MFFRVLYLLIVVCLAFADTAFAQSIQVLRFLDNDEGAIIKTVDGKIKTIKVGDVIESYELRVKSSELRKKDEDEFRVTGSGLKDTKHGTRNTEQKPGLRVTEISEGRIVFEERTNKGIETIIIRVEHGEQKIERISKVGDTPQVIYQSTKGVEGHEEKRE
jgi:hypothetical protein